VMIYKNNVKLSHKLLTWEEEHSNFFFPPVRRVHQYKIILQLIELIHIE